LRNDPVVADATEPAVEAAALVADSDPDGFAAQAGRQARRPKGLRWGCVGVWSAVLLVPLLVLAAILLPWWQRMQALDTDYASHLDQLSRYQRLVATLPGLRKELAREQANDDFKAFYFDAETPALAGARLQSEVQEMVRAAGARPISAQILPVDEEEQPPRVRIRTQFQGTTDELLDLLHRIESARPFLFVDQMSVRSTTPRARSVRRRSARGSLPQREVGQLTIRLDVFGYTLGGGA
jgi:general secretion pathway protein M